MRGKLIIIEGGDGSGKATQTAMLVERLAAEGRPVRSVSFPDYDSDSSALVKMYLRGDFGGDADGVNPYAASAFYAVDRFASYQTQWKSFLQDGGIVVAQVAHVVVQPGLRDAVLLVCADVRPGVEARVVGLHRLHECPRFVRMGGDHHHVVSVPALAEDDDWAVLGAVAAVEGHVGVPYLHRSG